MKTLLEDMGIDPSDSWKGVDLIKNVKRSPVGGVATHLLQMQQKRNRRKFCRSPGCGKELRPQTKWGLCRKHMHEAGLCKCTHCLRHPRQ